MKIVFVGGGTGGHVSPNIAVIDEMRKIAKKKMIDLEVLYMGRLRGIEKDIVKKQGIKYKGIFTGKWRRYHDWRNFTDLFLVLLGIAQSFFILIFNRPKIVFAKGGFVTVPVGIAAWFLRIPVVLHESDAAVGLSNRILLRFAKKIFVGFPIESYKNINTQKAIFTGNPVREDVLNSQPNREKLNKKYGLNAKKPVIFVFGGSQGANAINKLVDELLDQIVSRYVLIHSAGAREASYFKEGYLKLNENDRRDYLVFSHIGEEMGDFLANADLIVSRAGANSIAEMVALRKPSILMPLPSAAGDHQKKNAFFMQKHGMASVMDERFVSAEKLMEEIDYLVSNKNERIKMIKNMEGAFPENSSSIIANEVFKILGF